MEKMKENKKNNSQMWEERKGHKTGRIKWKTLESIKRNGKREGKRKYIQNRNCVCVT